MKVISAISSYFDYFLALDYQEWRGELPHIVENLERQKMMCDILVNYYVDVMASLKRRVNEARFDFLFLFFSFIFKFFFVFFIYEARFVNLTQLTGFIHYF